MTTGTADGSFAPSTPARHGRHPTRWVLVVLGLCLLGLLVFRLFQQPRSTAGGSMAPEARVVPVTVTHVSLGDLPIFIEGLGNVTPIHTVTVKTLVDGQLMNVHFKEGQMVHRGDLLAQVDPRPFAIQLAQGRAALARDVAQAKEAKLNYERFRMLGEQKLISQQQVDDQRASADQLQASTGVDQAQIDNAQLQLKYARIVSPIDGVTGVRLVDPGNIVHASDQTGIVVITQLDPITVLFVLPQDDQPRVARALAAGPVTVDAYSRGGDTKLGTGQLLLIDNQINQATATMRLKAIFPNPDRALWPNAFVKTRLLLTTRRSVVLVPSTVVQRGPQGTFAYVVTANQTVAVRPVDIEVVQGDTAIVARGLRPGEQVVTEGQGQLRPGARVAPRLVTQSPVPSASALPPGARPG
jgi:membrane fusion protein, multidrug efflux system